MLYRTIAALVLIGVTYTLGVFFLPKETDEIAALFGIEGLNENIRSLKLGADRVSTWLIDLKNSTGGIFDEVGGIVDKAREVADTTKTVVETKVDQTKKVVESAEKASQAVTEFRSNLDALTSLTGSTVSTGSTNSGSLSPETGSWRN